ncbi:sugar phosphate nucleotidyltransferase [Pseudomonas aeruginosa]
MNAVAPLIPCIVSGGSGTRLWPVSRESMPKPFMRLADDQSLLQKTFLRIAGLPDVARLLTVTNREPRVTVNINQAPGNTVFVGGAVRNPSAVPIPAANNMEQAILGAGGILPVGDARRVALMREDSEGRYHAYFLDFSQLMKIGPEGRKPLAMQRGDIVFVPKSMVGDRIEGVDVYLNQLLPFAKSIGVGVSYTVNNDR